MKTIHAKTVWFKAFRLGVIALLLANLSIASNSAAQNIQAGYIDIVRDIELDKLSVQGPAGIAYSAKADALVLVEGSPGQPKNSIKFVTRLERSAGSAVLGETVTDALNMAFDQKSNSLFLLNSGTEGLRQIPAEQEGKILSGRKASKTYNMKGFGLNQAQGMAFDPNNSRMFFLDPAGKQLVVIQPDAAGNYDINAAQRDGRLTKFAIKGVQENHLRGLAFDPGSRQLYTLGPGTNSLYRLTDTGDLVESYDISQFGLQNPQGLVVAPSGDPTDAPDVNNVYIADPQRNVVTEVTFTLAAAAALPTAIPANLVNIIYTSDWNPQSPDPAGVDYNPLTGRLIVSDSEVEEMKIYKGKNVFEPTTGGNLVTTCDTTSFTKEPTEVAVDAVNRRMYFSDDGKENVLEVNLGADGIYCTGDDSVRTISTASYNVVDGEGVAYGNGNLFFSDGLSAEVFRVSPGQNGIFDGGSPIGDDQVTHFDTASLGLRDTEGIGFYRDRGTLFLVSRRDKTAVETTVDGTPLRVFDLTSLNAVGPSGVGVGPGSQNPSSISIYISARGVDNNNDPNENDGKIYEVNIGDSSGPVPSPTPGPSPTPTPTPTPTNTPQPPGPVQLYLSFASGTSTIGNLTNVRDEDIVSFNGTLFEMVLDGSDVGVGDADIDAFTRIDNNTFLLSFDNDFTVPGVGLVNAQDVVQFEATSLGNNTAGTFQLFFDGNVVGLTSSASDIDTLDLLPDGRLLISTSGTISISGISYQDEDILAFTPAAPGNYAAGSWAVYFDGTDVGLNTDSGEDVDGAAVGGTGNLYLSTRGPFTVSGITGDLADIFVCTPVSLGNSTACNFSSTLFFKASNYGITGNNLDAFDLP